MWDKIITITWAIAFIGLFSLGPLLLDIRFRLRTGKRIAIGIILTDALGASVTWAAVTVGIISLLYMVHDLHLRAWIVEFVALGWCLIAYATLIRIILWYVHKEYEDDL